jgi:DNA-binding transcriptional MerR regulator
MFKTKKSRPENTPAQRTCSSSDVARIAGVSLRQLQWWDEQKVVSPRHEGHRRVYAPAEVVEISVIAELRRKGFSLQKIRRVLRFLQRDMGKRLVEVMNGSGEMHLLTDGKTILLEETEARVIDLLKNARQPMFLVCVSDQVRRIQLMQRKPAKTETTLATPARRANRASM